MDLEILIGALRWCVATALVIHSAIALAPRLLPGPAAGAAIPVERFLRAALLAVLFMVWPVALLGLLETLSATSLLVFAFGLGALAWRYRAPRAASTAVTAERWRGWRRRIVLFWPLAPAALLLLGDLFTSLPTPPTGWDAMTYHLYLPARWLAAGELVHVPTVFSDNSAAFAPQNGALFFTWHLGLSGHDTLITALQWGMLVFLAAALYRLARQLGAPHQAALMGAVTVFALFPLRRYAPTANVDVFMVALFGGGLHWLVAAWRRERGAALPAALVLGLAAGTKTVGLPFVAPLVAALLAMLTWRRRFSEGCAAGVALAASGGFWYVRNWALYGNPLFPLDWRFLGFHFAGAYERSALLESQFRVDAGRWLEVVGITWGAAAIALLILGFLVLAVHGVARRHVPSLALATLVLLGTWFAAFVVPHNNQTRFLLPALVAALPGWALLLGRLRGARRAALFLLALFAALWTSRPDLEWRFVLDRLDAAGVSTPAWLALFLAAGVVVPWASGRAHGRRVARMAAGWAAVALVAAFATGAGEPSRNAFLSQADFQLWRLGYLLFNDPTTPRTRIAYSGGNVPYALVGPGMRHFVVYCNTQGRPEDGFHDFWNRDRRLHPTYKPGLYRGPEDDYATWRACLEERGIEAVVLWRLLPVELPDAWPRDADFPIERRWMRERPELYEPFLTGPGAEIYLLR